MNMRIGLYATVVTLAVGGVVMVADALVITDEEQVGAVAGAIATAQPQGHAVAVLDHTDLGREPVRVDGLDFRDRFEGPLDEPHLAEALRDALRPLLDASRVEEVQRSVRVTRDEATALLRLRADGELVDLTLDLRRSGQSWLVTRLRAR